MDATTTVFNTGILPTSQPPLPIQSDLDSRTFSQPLRRLPGPGRRRPVRVDSLVVLSPGSDLNGERPSGWTRGDASSGVSQTRAACPAVPRGHLARHRIFIQHVGVSIQRGRAGATPQLAGGSRSQCPLACVKSPIFRRQISVEPGAKVGCTVRRPLRYETCSGVAPEPHMMSLVRLLGFKTLGCGCVTGRYREVATNREVTYVEEKGRGCQDHAHRRNHTLTSSGFGLTSAAIKAS